MRASRHVYINLHPVSSSAGVLECSKTVYHRSAFTSFFLPPNEERKITLFEVYRGLYSVLSLFCTHALFCTQVILYSSYSVLMLYSVLKLFCTQASLSSRRYSRTTNLLDSVKFSSRMNKVATMNLNLGVWKNAYFYLLL